MDWYERLFDDLLFAKVEKGEVEFLLSGGLLLGTYQGELAALLYLVLSLSTTAIPAASGPKLS